MHQVISERSGVTFNKTPIDNGSNFDKVRFDHERWGSNSLPNLGHCHRSADMTALASAQYSTWSNQDVGKGRKLGQHKLIICISMDEVAME